LPPTTSGLETEWDDSGRKGRDGQKKKISKANKRKGKVKRGKDEVNGPGERGVPRPHTGHHAPTGWRERNILSSDGLITLTV